jgi:hypothetical protein
MRTDKLLALLWLLSVGSMALASGWWGAGVMWYRGEEASPVLLGLTVVASLVYIVFTGVTIAHALLDFEEK